MRMRKMAGFEQAMLQGMEKADLSWKEHVPRKRQSFTEEDF